MSKILTDCSAKLCCGKNVRATAVKLELSVRLQCQYVTFTFFFSVELMSMEKGNPLTNHLALRTRRMN